MSWKDLSNRAMDWVKEKGAEIFAPKGKPYSDLGNGGSSGYYPGVAARQERTQKMAALKEEAAQQAMNQGAAPDAQAGYTAQMNGAAMQQGYTQQFQASPMQQGYTQQFQASPMQQGYTQQFQNPPAQGYTQQFPNAQAQGYTQQFASASAPSGYTQQFQTPPAQQGYTQQFQGNYQQGWGQQETWQQPAPQQVPDNISFMPGHYVDGSRAYAHVERITQLVSFQACYRIIEFMKNGESVIVNTESISNEAEVIRCIDMLSGAAYTLGCSITKITNIKRAYLISPPTVQVLADVYIRRMSDRRNEEGARRRSGRYAEEGEDRFGAQNAGDGYDAAGYDQGRMAAGYGGYDQGASYDASRGRSGSYQGGGYGAYSSFGNVASYAQ